jgi:hypothetical protein
LARSRASAHAGGKGVNTLSGNGQFRPELGNVLAVIKRLLFQPGNALRQRQIGFSGRERGSVFRP